MRGFILILTAFLLNQTGWTATSEIKATEITKTFKTQCELNVPMLSKTLFVQTGKIADFFEVTQMMEGHEQSDTNPYLPYCTFEIDLATFEKIAKNKSFSLPTGAYQFSVTSLEANGRDFFGQKGFSIHYGAIKGASAPWIGAHCFTPQPAQTKPANGTAAQSPIFSISDVETVFNSTCHSTVK